jgi:hypothetical protein
MPPNSSWRTGPPEAERGANSLTPEVRLAGPSYNTEHARSLSVATVSQCHVR